MRISLRFKLIFLIAGFAAITLLFVYFSLKASLEEYSFNRISTNLERTISVVQSFIEEAPDEDLSEKKMDALMDRVGRDLGVRATFIDDSGVVLGDSDVERENLVFLENHLYRPELQDAAQKGQGQSRRFSSTIKQDLLYMALPVIQNDQRIGFIRLAIPLSDIDVISQKVRLFLVISLIWAFFLSVIFGYVASLVIAVPIRNISLVAKKIANGQFGKKAYVNTNDEIEDLSNSINYMSEQIKVRMDEVVLSRSRFEAVLLSIFEGLMVLDKNGAIILMNPTLKEFLGITSSPIGRKPIEIMRNLEIQELADEIISETKGVVTRELHVDEPFPRQLLVHATAVIHDDKRDGAVFVFHDITELRRLEGVRKDFVANVSHELRTPVATIKGYAETLLEGALEDKENAKEFVQIIASDADRLAKLINDLLDLSSVESGKLEPYLTEISLSELVDHVFKVFDEQASQKKVLLCNNIKKDFGLINVDEAGMQQVFFNLVENAIKYNKEGGGVDISALVEDEFIVIKIKDDGIGIPSEDLPRIFERFYRVDKARSRQLGGTGLGLSIVKHIVQFHGGDVSVESSLQSGTVFTVRIPNK